MAIFMTGDTHGDFSRLRPAAFYEQVQLTKADYLVICGDFGGIWDGSNTEQQWLDWLENRPFTTLFVSGNHENFDLLCSYPINQWHGGLVQVIRPSVLHLMRGQLYEISGKRIFTMGGASSHDIQDGVLEPDDPNFERKLRQLNAAGALFRVDHHSWWKEELPDDAEYQTARETLDNAGWDVDYIIPANDDAIRAVKLITSVMADAIVEAKQGESFDEGAAEETADVEEAAEEAADEE